jgi:integrase
MSTTVLERLTLAEASRMIADATKDKSFLELPMGCEIGRYLRAKRKELTETSYIGYEGCLHKLALQFAYLELADFEIPVGSERIEEWMDQRWGDASPGTYNVNHSILSDFFKWQIRHQRMRSNPMGLVGRARKRDVLRTTFSNDQRHAIIASSPGLRDRIALRLLFDYGIRKGALRAVQFKHFDYQRRRLTIFTKGGKVRALPIPHAEFWTDLERLVLEWEAQPDHFLLCLIKPIPRAGLKRFPDRAMSNTATHRWWYRRLELAGLVAPGTTGTHGQMKMHAARHTAGQRLLDATGNLKAAQRLLGHASIQTTGDIYVDHDLDQLTQSLADVLSDDDETNRS